MNTASSADRAGWPRGPIRSEGIAAVLADDGYHVSAVADNLLRVVEPESGVVVLAALEGNVLFFTISCVSVPPQRLTGDVLRRMIASGNGIATSSFRLIDRSDSTVAVTLNNFCKLQDMGPEDCDDLLSCIEFLLVDVLFARALIEGDNP